MIDILSTIRKKHALFFWGYMRALVQDREKLFQSRNLVCIAGLAISAAGLIISTMAESAIDNILWLSVALGGAGFAQTLS